MSEVKRVKDAAAPSLFRAFWPKSWRRLQARRFAGLKSRQGIEPTGEAVTLDSRVQYYTNKESRDTHAVSVSDLEAKPAADDWFLKVFGTFLFFAIFALSLICVGWDEVRAVLFPTAPPEYRISSIIAWILGGTLAFLAVFGWMYQNFTKMDQVWYNCVDSFFAFGARPQMDAVRDCMREFKRFVKWRRYMRLMMTFAVVILGIEIILLIFSGQVGHALGWELSWSTMEIRFAIAFLVAQVIWFALYWWMWVNFTLYRDPTLQLCVMVNVMDRANVATTNMADRSRR